MDVLGISMSKLKVEFPFNELEFTCFYISDRIMGVVIHFSAALSPAAMKSPFYFQHQRAANYLAERQRLGL